MDIITKGIELAANNKEFSVLIGILWYSIKSHNSMKVQQAICTGKFDKLDLINSNTEKKTEESDKKSTEAREIAGKAEETADKAFRCVRQINKKVDTLIDTVDDAKRELQDRYKQYIDGKHTESLTKD